MASSVYKLSEVRRSRKVGMHNLLLLGVFFLKLIMNNEIETTPTIKTNVVVMSFSINIGSTLFAFHILGETQEVYNQPCQFIKLASGNMPAIPPVKYLRKESPAPTIA